MADKNRFFIMTVSERFANNCELLLGDKKGNTVLLDQFNVMRKYCPNLMINEEVHTIEYRPDEGIHIRDGVDLSVTEPKVDAYDNEIEVVEDILANMADPLFDLSLITFKRDRMDELKAKTYEAVVKCMPEWRQIRWQNYMTIYDKLSGGGTLSALEQVIYDGFPGVGETNESCYNNCVSAIGWIMECIAANNASETAISSAETVDEVNSVVTTYPDWPL